MVNDDLKGIRKELWALQCGNKFSGSIRGRKFLQQLRNCHLIKGCFVAWKTVIVMCMKVYSNSCLEELEFHVTPMSGQLIFIPGFDPRTF
jgi:hypothetical protein